jgi:hypothetical protein
MENSSDQRSNSPSKDEVRSWISIAEIKSFVQPHNSNNSRQNNAIFASSSGQDDTTDGNQAAARITFGSVASSSIQPHQRHVSSLEIQNLGNSQNGLNSSSLTTSTRSKNKLFHGINTPASDCGLPPRQSSTTAHAKQKSTLIQQAKPIMFFNSVTPESPRQLAQY